MTKFNKSGFNASAGNQVQELRYNLLQSCSWLTNGTRKLLKPYGITPKQYSILRNLAKNSPESASIQEVRDGLADKMSDASRLIDRLVSKGYLDKFPSDFDRRSNRVRISDSGLAILKEINSQKEDLDRLVSDLLSEKEIHELNRLLSLLK
ncbi:MarR family transcriptional regulator [Neolewinella aurantiaca]|uniref:MarR family transcriptional regulator n=1 Tax=Neolewinella aurantiaca TaxID=2602767 RepID=A0A5C7FLN5_9BACT|nr:MarR family transcriptional regulator [Neolewinella aurantiaca]TXF85655.1 MarR family transcriptional regulator [Neolewinella aurantiaca]